MDEPLQKAYRIDELLQKPYWIIDILPSQVPAESPGQYFAVEKYFLAEKKFSEIKQKHIDLVLKLNCYKNISIGEDGTINPSPSLLAEEMRKRYIFIRVENAMILSEPDDTHMTVFNPDKSLLELIKVIAAGEGLYAWQPPQ